MKRKRSASPLPSTSGKTINASHDALNVESNVAQQSQIKIQCKGCSKKIQEKSMLLHLRSKKCKQHYNDEEYSDLLTKRDEARKDYKKQHKKSKPNSVSNVVTMPEPTNTCSNRKFNWNNSKYYIRNTYTVNKENDIKKDSLVENIINKTNEIIG